MRHWNQLCWVPLDTRRWNQLCRAPLDVRRWNQLCWAPLDARHWKQLCWAPLDTRHWPWSCAEMPRLILCVVQLSYFPQFQTRKQRPDPVPGSLDFALRHLGLEWGLQSYCCWISAPYCHLLFDLGWITMSVSLNLFNWKQSFNHSIRAAVQKKIHVMCYDIIVIITVKWMVDNGCCC